MTQDQIADLCGSAKRAEIFYPYLADSLPSFGITGRLREAAFLAEIMHESGSLVYTREIASGKAYEGRKDLGNVFPGDGVRFKGRGLIQITGRTNYSQASKGLFGDDRLLTTPELLATPQFAAISAAWWWKQKGLNELADRGKLVPITRVVNGGLNGEAEREAYYRLALDILK